MRFYSSVTLVVMEIALFPLTLIQMFFCSLTEISFQVTELNSEEDLVLLRVALYTHDFSLFGFSLLSRTISGI